MRLDVTIHSTTPVRHSPTSLDNVEASISTTDTGIQAIIYKTQRDLKIQHFNLIPGAIIEDANQSYRILTIAAMDKRPRYLVCNIERIENLNSALQNLKKKPA